MSDETTQAKAQAFRDRLLRRDVPSADTDFEIPAPGDRPRALPMPIRSDRPEPGQGELFPLWLMHKRVFGQACNPAHGPDASGFLDREEARREAAAEKNASSRGFDF